MKKVLVFVAVVLAVLVAALIAGQVFMGGKGIYKDKNITLKYPKGWQASIKTDMNFYPPGMTEGLKSNISLRVDDMMARNAVISFSPLQLKRALAQNIDNIKYIAEKESETRDPKAYKIVYEGKFNNVEVRGIRIFIAKGAKLYTISYIAPLDSYEKDLPVFNKFFKSLKI